MALPTWVVQTVLSKATELIVRRVGLPQIYKALELGKIGYRYYDFVKTAAQAGKRLGVTWNVTTKTWETRRFAIPTGLEGKIRVTAPRWTTVWKEGPVRPGELPRWAQKVPKIQWTKQIAIRPQTLPVWFRKAEGIQVPGKSYFKINRDLEEGIQRVRLRIWGRDDQGRWKTAYRWYSKRGDILPAELDAWVKAGMRGGRYWTGDEPYLEETGIEFDLARVDSIEIVDAEANWGW